MATQDYFRNQFLAFRPLGAIQADILVALRSAAICQDPIALTRLCLIGSELHQRGFHLDQAHLVPLLLKLEDPHIAIEYLRTGNQLQVEAGTTLKASRMLRSLGLEEESKRLFELAEPLDLLTGSVFLGQRNTDGAVSLFEDWAQTAVLFQPVGRLIQVIRQIQYKDDDFNGGDEEQSPSILQSRLLLYAGLGLLDQQRWSV